MRNTSKRPLVRQLSDDPQVLQDAITLMESRLRRLGDGDCAYEKAMSRFYEQQLVLHHARLYLSQPPQSSESSATVSGFSGRV